MTIALFLHFKKASIDHLFDNLKFTKIHYCSEKSLEKVLNPVILIMFRLYHIPAVQFAAAVATVQDLIEPIVLVLAVLSRTAE